MQLTHQTQPTKRSCEATCIAMLTNKPAQQVIDTWHDKLMSFDATIDQALKFYGVEHFFFGDDRNTRLFANTVYLLSVPSLNMVGQRHCIIAACSPDLTVTVFDPAKGLGGDIKQYVYRKEGETFAPDEIQLVSWDVIIAIPVHNPEFWN